LQVLESGSRPQSSDTDVRKRDTDIFERRAS
jgi:hypothetical protein